LGPTISSANPSPFPIWWPAFRDCFVERMEYSVDDYYSILGLDPGASQESIKLVYRRLARDHHPDRKTSSTESEREGFSAYMAKLNGAYVVLSNAKLRSEYDQKQKILSSLQTCNTVTQVIDTSSQLQFNSRNVPQDELDLVLAREFSKQLRTKLMRQHRSLSWKEKTLEGFDWGLEGSSWLSHYCVAGRGFAVLDLQCAKKFINYSRVIVASCTRSVRKKHFLFLLPFQRLYEWESVSAEFNRFFSAESQAKFFNVPVEIALVDARQSRSVRFGRHLRGKWLEELRRSVSTTR
jgi:curved DNA-binding protein CbpA